MAEPRADRPGSPRRPGLAGHLVFTLLCGLALLALYTLLRCALLWYNHDLAGPLPAATLAEAFLNGLRFDLRLVGYGLIPLILCTTSARAIPARRFMVGWLTAFASLTLFFGLVELDFYREFHQRLNALVFQYLVADPLTVAKMLWFGFPVLSYLLAWALGSWLLYRVFKRLDGLTRWGVSARGPAGAAARSGAFALCLLATLLMIRGTVQQGPPMRWGAAYTTDSPFANQLGLNGNLSLAGAAAQRLSGQRDNIWKARLSSAEALALTRRMLLSPEDELVDRDTAAVRRVMHPPATGALPVRNVVVILLESFAGHYVGAMGAGGDITPNFDRLSREGLLFTRFFANGTHTHQGMFATLACFPNLPGFEYLMQQPEGAHRFSGLPQLLQGRGYEDLYVYNGDFSWDNQAGFFGNQGMHNFIGRRDFVDPVFSDPTWGVSDQDMFDRAAWELETHFGGHPFYAVLQSLSNHTPYALPATLPVAPVAGFGHLDEHLTAMRYSDWALGEFFARARKLPYYDQTLFVIVGDHGFGSPEQLTDMDLYRFHVPLLLIAPGIRERFGDRLDRVGTQVDIVPTIMGRLGLPVEHQCWGRDLLALNERDHGFGLIKPSGSDQTVALIRGDRILVEPRHGAPVLYRYRLHEGAGAERLPDTDASQRLRRQLEAFVQVATRSLLDDTAGATGG